MKHDIQSPLPPMRLGPAPERALRHLDGLGASIHLLRHMHWHGLLPMNISVPLIIAALRENRVYFALTPNQQPFGLATWHWTSSTHHHTWLKAPPSIALFATAQSQAFLPSNGQENDLHVWFSLLACPFGGQLAFLQELKARMGNEVKKAWAITPYGPGVSGPHWKHPQSQVRALW